MLKFGDIVTVTTYTDNCLLRDFFTNVNRRAGPAETVDISPTI